MIASKRHTVNIKNINIRHTQFGGASLDINTALPRASRQKKTKKKNQKDKESDKEEEQRIRTKTKNPKDKEEETPERQGRIHLS